MKTQNMNQTQTQTIITKSGKILDPQQMHVCRLCDKLLSSSSSLDRHMLTHSGERPFVCKRCHMTFTTNGNMHRHMRTHLHKDSLARQQQEQMQLKQSLLVGGNAAAASHLHQITGTSGHSQMTPAAPTTTLPGGFYSAAPTNQQHHHHHLAQQLAQQQSQQPMLAGPLASLIAGNVSAAAPQQNHQNPVTALLNQQLIAAALQQQQQQQQQQQRQSPVATASQRTAKHSGIISANTNNNQEVSTTFHQQQQQHHQRQADISSSAAQLLQKHHQALVANQMMQAHQAPLEHHLDPKALVVSALAAAGRQHGAGQTQASSLESVKTVMLAAAAAAAAVVNQKNQRESADLTGSSTDLLMEVPSHNFNLDQQAGGRVRGKRRKQVNPLRSSHRLDDSSASTSECEPQLLGRGSPVISPVSSHRLDDSSASVSESEPQLTGRRSSVISPASSLAGADDSGHQNPSGDDDEQDQESGRRNPDGGDDHLNQDQDREQHLDQDQDLEQEQEQEREQEQDQEQDQDQDQDQDLDLDLDQDQDQDLEQESGHRNFNGGDHDQESGHRTPTEEEDDDDQHDGPGGHRYPNGNNGTYDQGSEHRNFNGHHHDQASGHRNANGRDDNDDGGDDDHALRRISTAMEGSPSLQVKMERNAGNEDFNNNNQSATSTTGDDDLEGELEEGDEEDDEIVEDISQSYVKTANPNATRKGGKRNRHCYKCKLCTYSSVDRCTLVRHLRIHSGERPYICGICRYAFTTKANCERHVRKRHKKQYNSLGGSGGVKGSNGGGRSLIITDHSNHQTIPVKVNPVAAQTISQTLQRIQEKEQQQQQQQTSIDNVVRLDSQLRARENDNIERINDRAGATNTMNNGCSSGGGLGNKRKHRQADSREHAINDEDMPAYQRRRTVNKLHKSTAGDQPRPLSGTFNPFASCDNSPLAGPNNLGKQAGDFLLDQAAIHAAANSFMGVAAASVGAPSAGEDADLANNNQTNELFVNLLAQIQQMTNNNNQQDIANGNNLPKQPSSYSMQRQQSNAAISPSTTTASIFGEPAANPMSEATFLANMLAAGKAMASDSSIATQQRQQQPVALTEQLNSLLSSKHLSQQLRNLNLQNPFFGRRNPFDPFSSLDFAQALDLSCKLQTHK